MKLIPLDALIAEMKKRKKQHEEWKNSCKGIDSLAASMVIQEDINILSFIDTLEVKEVNLEEEIERVRKTHFINDDFEKATLEGRQITNIAKHFFELGLKAQKGE